MSEQNTLHVVASIVQGDHDDALERITDAIRSRRDILARMKAATINLGDHVRLNDQTNPAYLRGRTGTVSQIGQKSALVTSDEKLPGRFGHSQSIRVPVSLLEPVE